MVNISNELSHSSRFQPIPESILESESLNAFKENADDVNQGIENLLKILTERPEGQGYKFLINATSIGTSTAGPIKTYTGAFWNADQDGTWATHLESLKLLVSITWIRV